MLIPVGVNITRRTWPLSPIGGIACPFNVNSTPPAFPTINPIDSRAVIRFLCPARSVYSQARLPSFVARTQTVSVILSPT